MILEHNGLLPHFAGLQFRCVGYVDGDFAPVAVRAGAKVGSRNHDIRIGGYDFVAAGGFAYRCAYGAVVIGREIGSCAALHIHCKGSAGSEKHVGLANVETAVVVRDVGELLGHGGALEVVEGYAVDGVVHGCTTLSVHARDVQGVAEVAKDVVVDVVAGSRYYFVRLRVLDYFVFVHEISLVIVNRRGIGNSLPFRHEPCLKDNERILFRPVGALVEIIAPAGFYPQIVGIHGVTGGRIVAAQRIVLNDRRHEAGIHVGFGEPGIGVRLTRGAFVVGEAVEVDLELPVHRLVVVGVGIERSHRAIHGSVEHLEGDHLEVGNTFSHVDFHLGEVAYHLDALHVSGLGDGAEVPAAPVCEAGIGGHQGAHEGAFVHEVHLHGLEFGHGLGGCDELYVAVAGRHGGESFHVEGREVLLRLGAAVESGFFGRRVGLRAGLCLHYFVEDVARVENGEVEVFDGGGFFSHRGGLGHPVALVLGVRQVKGAVEGDFIAVGDLGSLDHAEVFLDAGAQRRYKRKSEENMSDNFHNQ